MAEETKRDLHNWIAVGVVPGDGVHLYRFTSPYSTEEKARHQFENICAAQGWTPFEKLFLTWIQDNPERETLHKFGMFSLSELNQEVPISYRIDNAQ